MSVRFRPRKTFQIHNEKTSNFLVLHWTIVAQWVGLMLIKSQQIDLWEKNWDASYWPLPRTSSLGLCSTKKLSHGELFSPSILVSTENCWCFTPSITFECDVASGSLVGFVSGTRYHYFVACTSPAPAMSNCGKWLYIKEAKRRAHHQLITSFRTTYNNHESELPKQCNFLEMDISGFNCESSKRCGRSSREFWFRINDSDVF